MLARKLNFSVFKRFASVQASFEKIENENISKKPHAFKKKLFITHAELAEYLEKNLIFNEEGLLILNKPYGLKKEQTVSHKSMKRALHPSVSNIDHLSFNEVLPDLVSKFSVDNLNLIKLPERYCSGISILSSEEKITERILKSLKNRSYSPYTFLLLCIGIPKESENSVTLGVTLNVKGSEKRVSFLETWSKNSSIKRKVRPLNVHHRVLSVNEKLNVSLLQLVVNRNIWNCLRLYCVTNLFAPCLGDTIMAPRLRSINGVPVVVDPFSPAANSVFNPPDEILEALRIRKNDINSIPLHMHLSQVDLLRCGHSGKTFIAKPPEHFLWSCEQLGISIPKEYLENCWLPFKKSEHET